MDGYRLPFFPSPRLSCSLSLLLGSLPYPVSSIAPGF
jgi:hypothetical protein